MTGSPLRGLDGPARQNLTLAFDYGYGWHHDIDGRLCGRSRHPARQLQTHPEQQIIICLFEARSRGDSDKAACWTERTIERLPKSL
jgi:hypothetical protein